MVTIDTNIVPKKSNCKVRDFLIVIGAVLAPFSYFNLPISGGETTALMALAWFPLFILIIFEVLANHRVNILTICFSLLILLGILWFPIILLKGDIISYITTLMAFTAGVTIAVTASNIKDPELLIKFLSVFFIIFNVVFLYGILFQSKVLFDIPILQEVDRIIRKSFLTRAKIFGRVTLFASEPSFAAYQITSTIVIAILYKTMISKWKYIATIVFGVICLISTFAITSILMLGLVILLMINQSFYLNKKMKVIFLICIIMMGSLFWGHISKQSFLISLINRIRNIDKDPSAVTRYILAASTWNAGIKTVFIGLGPGQYAMNWNNFISDNEESIYYTTPNFKSLIDSERKIKPYSLMGGILADFGLLGFLLFLVVVISILIKISISKRLSRFNIVLALLVVLISFNGAYPVSLPNMWLLLGLIYRKVFYI
jgi:hypothetical protein